MRQRPLSMLFAAEITDRALLAQVVIEGGRVFGQRIQMGAEHFDLLHQRMLLRHRTGGAQFARQLFILRPQRGFALFGFFQQLLQRLVALLLFAVLPFEAALQLIHRILKLDFQLAHCHGLDPLRHSMMA